MRGLKLITKTTIVGYTMLIAFIFCGCGTEPQIKTEEQIKQENNWGGFEVIVVDSCEYLNQFDGPHSGYRFTHKGNCKFCTERSKNNYKKI